MFARNCFFLILGLCFSLLANAAERTLLLETQNTGLIAKDIVQKKEKAKRFFLKPNKGIEIILADGTTKSLESFAGHIFIRLLDDDDDELNDTVISFNIYILNNSKKYDKAFGGFPMLPVVDSFLNSVVQYVKAEIRPIQRIILPSDAETISKLKSTILDLQEVPALLNEYHFTSNNCLTGTMKLLRQIGYPIYELPILDAPFGVQSILKLNFSAFYPEHESLKIVGAYEIIKKIEMKMGSPFSGFLGAKDFIDYLKNPITWELIGDLTEDEIEVLTFFWPIDAVKYFPEMMAIYKARVKNPHSTLSLLKLKKWPDSLYQFCGLQDGPCRAQRVKDIRSIWTQDQVNSYYSFYKGYHRREIERTKQLARPAEKLKVLDTFVPFEIDLLSKELMRR